MPLHINVLINSQICTTYKLSFCAKDNIFEGIEESTRETSQLVIPSPISMIEGVPHPDIPSVIKKSTDCIPHLSSLFGTTVTLRSAPDTGTFGSR